MICEKVLYNFDKKTDRNIAIDILKICSMLMVVILHATGYGLQGAEIPLGSLLYWIVLVLRNFSIVAVNCFVLISGYYLSTGKNYSNKKVIRLWSQVEMYSVGIYLLLCAVPSDAVTFNVKVFIRQLFPVLANQYWFFTCYIILLVVSPLLNCLINALDREQYKKSLSVLLVIFSVLPTINIWGDSFGTNSGYSLLWFMILYLVAAYFRRYPLKDGHYGIVYGIICLFLCVVQVMCNILENKIPLISLIPNLFSMYNSVPVLLAAVCLFTKAINTQILLGKGMKKIVSRISMLSFGVYLLHEHPQIRDILWKQWVHLLEYVNLTGMFIGRFSLIVVLIFGVGLLVEFLREKVVAFICRK